MTYPTVGHSHLIKIMKKRILLVEDNLDLVEIVQKELKSFGYDVRVAKNGIEAVEMADSQLPDLIIMDIMMPDMDGFQATSRIRKNPNTQAIPILAATAMVAPGSKERCLASGCDAYVAKPFTALQLEAAIENLLKGSKEEDFGVRALSAKMSNNEYLKLA